jgi:hypothetical protein
MVKHSDIINTFVSQHPYVATYISDARPPSWLINRFFLDC